MAGIDTVTVSQGEHEESGESLPLGTGVNWLEPHRHLDQNEFGRLRELQLQLELELEQTKLATEEARCRNSMIEAKSKREFAQEQAKWLEEKTRAEEISASREQFVAQEKTKQVQIEKEEHVRLAEIEAQERTKQVGLECELSSRQAEEQAKIAISKIEADNKRELALEKTKQVKIENEERTKQIFEEQYTKQMMAMNETLSHCVKLTEQLRLAGSNKQVIEGIVKNVLGNSENNQKFSSSSPKATPSETQSRFPESTNNRKLMLPPRKSNPSHSLLLSHRKLSSPGALNNTT